jgi:hypothetical protein
MDCSVQGYIRTPPDLCPPFGFRAFLLGEPPVRRPGCCKAHQTPFRLWSIRYSTVQLCGPLAGCTLTGLGTTPLAWPIRAKPPFITYLEPNFCHRRNPRIYEVLLCHIWGRVARWARFRPWAVIRVTTPNAHSARATILAGRDVCGS